MKFGWTLFVMAVAFLGPQAFADTTVVSDLLNGTKDARTKGLSITCPNSEISKAIANALEVTTKRAESNKTTGIYHYFVRWAPAGF